MIRDVGNPADWDWTIDTLSGNGPATAELMVPSWALGAGHLQPGQTLFPDEVQEWDPTAQEVGWGLILPDRPELIDGRPDIAADAPEPIQQLLEKMSGKVLRYREGTPIQEAFLHDYPAGQDLHYAAGSAVGRGPGQIPRFLLIVGTPQQIPWRVQSQLNGSFFVGRLDLDEEGLANYVSCRLTDWAGSAARYDAPVVWSAVLGDGDITAAMRAAIGDTLTAELRNDKDTDFPNLSYLGDTQGPAGLGAELAAALRANTPAMVVTTSHGVTEPYDADQLPDRLGLPVDANLSPVDPGILLEHWQPDGAVWFAQACCSAGADAPSCYSNLFGTDTAVAKALAGAASAGAITAPLPRALLGARRPLRAFIGRVEPTFRWTIQNPWTNAPLSADLVSAIYRGVCGFKPVGFAFRNCYRPIGGLLSQADQLAVSYDTTEDDVVARQVRSLAVYNRVVAYDRANLMILGDPAVALPRPTAALTQVAGGPAGS